MRPPLPLLLAAAMLAIGVAIELALFARVELAPKLPLALLLGLAFARGGVGRAR
ncbi:MAG TPA: hypothetical protein VI942_04515 [Thermoanaerobaculia bacterium]|nr:hypothetical protein [Thermoanaerobaculia bacterium]